MGEKIQQLNQIRFPSFYQILTVGSKIIITNYATNNHFDVMINTSVGVCS